MAMGRRPSASCTLFLQACIAFDKVLDADVTGLLLGRPNAKDVPFRATADDIVRRPPMTTECDHMFEPETSIPLHVRRITHCLERVQFGRN
jgi:hypothetical protein